MHASMSRILLPRLIIAVEGHACGSSIHASIDAAHAFYISYVRVASFNNVIMFGRGGRLHTTNIASKRLHFLYSSSLFVGGWMRACVVHKY